MGGVGAGAGGGYSKELDKDGEGGTLSEDGKDDFVNSVVEVEKEPSLSTFRCS